MAEERLDVQGFGFKARILGADLKVIILVILVGGGLGYLIWDHDHREGANLTVLIEEISALTYVTSLTPAERKELQLGMPDALRRKITPIH